MENRHPPYPTREERRAGFHTVYEPPTRERSRLLPDLEADDDGGFWGFFFALLIGCAVALMAALAFAPFLQAPR